LGDEPHWQRLRAGCYLGYRPSRKEGRGKWFARVYDEEAARYRRKALGDFASFTGNDVFKAARKEADAFAEKVESGGLNAEPLDTVADACRAYLEARPGPIAAGIFRRYVFDDPIARVKLDKLRKHHLRDWRQRLEATPALLTRNKGGVRRTKVRSGSTVNRDMVPVRAALFRVLSPGAPNTDAAWQEALKPAIGVDRRRELYLDLEQRRKLLAAVDRDAAPFARALCLLPLRPGAAAELKVRHFDSRTRTLTISKDKNKRPRQISVPHSLAGFLAEQSEGKDGAAYLFTHPDGGSWSKDRWKKPIKKGVLAAGLPAEATAYTLRHSVITDLVREGLPILTVAQLADTSVAMIERHYGHLVRHDAEVALAALAL
jgi:site-specific recombinase XerD